MIRRLHYIVALVVALMLPLQSAAFAMAKMGAIPHTHGHVQAHSDHDGASKHEHPADPCDDEGKSGLKCCHTPAAWLDSTMDVFFAADASLERVTFVARWTSFIPEEPSPPPIAPNAS